MKFQNPDAQCAEGFFQIYINNPGQDQREGN